MPKTARSRKSATGWAVLFKSLVRDQRTYRYDSRASDEREAVADCAAQFARAEPGIYAARAYEVLAPRELPPAAPGLREAHAAPDRPYPGRNARERFGADERESEAPYQYDTRRHEHGFTERTRFAAFMAEHGFKLLDLAQHNQFAPWPFRWGSAYIGTKARGLFDERGALKHPSLYLPEKKIEVARISPYPHFMVWHSDDLLYCRWTGTIREDWEQYGYAEISDKVRKWQRRGPPTRTFKVYEFQTGDTWNGLFDAIRREGQKHY